MAAASLVACLDFERAVDQCLEVGRCLPPDGGAFDGGVELDAGTDAGSDAGCLPPHGFSPCDAGVCGLRWMPARPCVDGAPFALSAMPGSAPRVAARGDGSGFLVVWTERDASSRTVVRGLELSTTQPKAPFSVPSDGGAQVAPDVSFHGTQGIVVHGVDGGAVFAQRLGVDGAPFVIAGGRGATTEPSVASGGGFHLVAWVESIVGVPDPGVMARFVPLTGQVGTPLPSLGFTRPGSRPAIAFTGSEFLVAWEDALSNSGQIRYQLVPLPANDGGTVARTVPFEAPHLSPAVACGIGSCVVTWTAGQTSTCNSGRCIRAARIDGPTGAQQELDLSTAQWQQTGNAVAAHADGYVAAWVDLRPMAPGVYGARVRPDGGVLDVNGVPLVRTTGAVGNVAIACHEDLCLLVYEQR